jgi:hypothetical protein
MPPIGLSRFARAEPARGSMFSARQRLGLTEESSIESAVPEKELYGA